MIEEEEVVLVATKTIEEIITGMTTIATVKNLILEDGDNNKFLSMASLATRVQPVAVDINLSTLATEVCVEVLAAKGIILNVLKLPILLLQILFKQTEDRIKVVSIKEVANHNRHTRLRKKHYAFQCL